MDEHTSSTAETREELARLRARVAALETTLAASQLAESQGQAALATLGVSEDLLRLLADNTADILFVLDLASSRNLYVSPAVERLTGYTVAEAMSLTLSKTMSAESLAALRPQHLQRARLFLSDAPGPHNYTDELVQVRKDGSTFSAEMVTQYTTNPGGQPIVVGMLRDITTRKLAEAALRQSEARWHAIVNTSPDGICIASVDGIVQFVSGKVLEKHGFDRPEDIIGKSVFEFLDPGYYAMAARKLQDLLDGQHSPVTEYKLIRKDGTRFFMDVNAEFLRDETGRPTDIFFVERDVTVRKQAEQALREANAYLENLIDYANGPIIVWDAQLRITRFNHAFESLTGRAEADVLGQSLEILFPPALAESAMALIRRTVTGERWEAVEIEIQHRDGSTRTVLWNSATLFGPDGQAAQATIAQGQDITARKRAEEALESLNRELEARVAQRTAQYLDTILRLEEEVRSRRIAEERLRQLQDSLVERVAAQGRKINMLYEAMLAYDSLSRTDQTFVQLMRRIADMMEADAVCIHELRAGRLELAASLNLSDADRQIVQTLPDGWLDKGVPLSSADLQHDPRLPPPLQQVDYRAYLAARIKPNTAEYGVLQVFWRQAQRTAVEDIASFTIIAEQVGIMIENSRLRQSLEQKAVQLERRRLARELHDSVTQSLHSLALYASVLRNRLNQGRPDKVEETLDVLDQTARQALKEMRLLLYEMRLESLEVIRLVEAIRTRLDAVETRAGIDAAVVLLDPAQWPAAWEAEMYPIAMEALNNSLKHAYARHVRVQLRGGPSWVEMDIWDDGRGFQSGAEPLSGGIGLHSMQERAERLGGTLRVESSPGGGTRVILRVGQPG